MKSLHKTTKWLGSQGIASVRRKRIWSGSSILQLICNDGDTLMFTFVTKMIGSGVKMLGVIVFEKSDKGFR